MAFFVYASIELKVHAALRQPVVQVLFVVKHSVDTPKWRVHIFSISHMSTANGCTGLRMTIKSSPSNHHETYNFNRSVVSVLCKLEFVGTTCSTSVNTKKWHDMACAFIY